MNFESVSNYVLIFARGGTNYEASVEITAAKTHI